MLDWRTSLRRFRLTTAVLSAGALAGALLSVTALVRELVPDPSPSIEARIAAVLRGPTLTAGQFPAYQDLATGGALAPREVTSADMRLGIVVTARVELHGLRGRTVVMCWSLVRTEAIDPPIIEGDCSQPVHVSANGRTTYDMWIPLPEQASVLRISIAWSSQTLDSRYVRDIPREGRLR
jgi:hypothetical protein